MEGNGWIDEVAMATRCYFHGTLSRSLLIKKMDQLRIKRALANVKLPINRMIGTLNGSDNEFHLGNNLYRRTVCQL